MPETFPFEKRYKYPHMKERDVAIWERFIEKYPDAFDTIQYDFMVGDPPPFNPLGDDDEDLRQDDLYRLKIDAVARKGNEIFIIELKPKASASTIGQVEGYRTLFIRDEAPKVPVYMVIITDTLQQNMQYLCDLKDVRLYIV